LIINHALVCCFRLLLVDLLAIFRRFGHSCGFVSSLMLFWNTAVDFLLIFALQCIFCPYDMTGTAAGSRCARFRCNWSTQTASSGYNLAAGLFLFAHL
jgi:hypothetical protein